MRKSLLFASALAVADAFSTAPGLGLAPSKALRASSMSLRPSVARTVMQAGDDPKISFNANSDWKPEHHKTGPEQTGNVDTGDYFEGDVAADSTGFTSGAAATGGTGGNQLQTLLSAQGTEVRQVERQEIGDVEFNHPKQAWKIDGTYESGDPMFDILYSVAETKGESEIYIEPNAMTFEDFAAGFTPDSDDGWEVEPKKGTMARRGGDGTWFTVKYTGTALDKAPKQATFVIVLPNDNFQWTFKLRCNFPN